MNSEELVQAFEKVSRDALAAKDRFGLTKDWYLQALANSKAMTPIEYQACIEELDRRMAEINALEKSLPEQITDESLMRTLATMQEIVLRINKMQEWIVAEGDRLELPR